MAMMRFIAASFGLVGTGYGEAVWNRLAQNTLTYLRAMRNHGIVMGVTPLALVSAGCNA